MIVVDCRGFFVILQAEKYKKHNGKNDIEAKGSRDA
jgi:hypothetical protein